MLIETVGPSKVSVDIPITVTPAPITLLIFSIVCPTLIPSVKIPVITSDPIPNVPTPTTEDLKNVPIPPIGCPIVNANVDPGVYPLPPLPRTLIAEIVPAVETFAVKVADTGSPSLTIIPSTSPIVIVDSFSS